MILLISCHGDKQILRHESEKSCSKKDQPRQKKMINQTSEKEKEKKLSDLILCLKHTKNRMGEKDNDNAESSAADKML